MFDRLSVSMSAEQTGHLDLQTSEGMKAWLRFYIRYCAKNPEHVRMMINESISENERLEYMVSRIRRSHKALIPVFKRLMSDGVVPEVWLVSFFFIVSSICQMPFVLSTTISRLYNVDMASEAAIEAHTDAVIALILGERSLSPAHWPLLPQWALLAQAKPEGEPNNAA
jgi:hypothetical protein